MKPRKNMWNQQLSSVCKVVGLALLLKDLQRIGRKFGISKHDPLMVKDFVRHAPVVPFCSRNNPVSRRTENLIEKRIVIHPSVAPLEDSIQRNRGVRESPQDVHAPLWATLWGLATRSCLADAKIKTALFGFSHMMEHPVLKDQWKIVCHRREEDSEIVGQDRETLSLRRELLDMQWANRRLEKLIENLRSHIDSSASPDPSPGGFPQ